MTRTSLKCGKFSRYILYSKLMRFFSVICLLCNLFLATCFKLQVFFLKKMIILIINNQRKRQTSLAKATVGAYASRCYLQRITVNTTTFGFISFTHGTLHARVSWSFQYCCRNMVSMDFSLRHIYFIHRYEAVLTVNVGQLYERGFSRFLLSFIE